MIAARRGLPSGRAVLGGLLVTVAALGTWWVATGADRGATEEYVVAAERLGPGQRLGPDQLRLARLDLPDAVRANAFADPAELDGAVVMGPVGAGELIQAGSVTNAADAGIDQELSFAVDPNWAVAGDLRIGDHIDVYATVEGGDGTASTRVLTDAPIIDLQDRGGDGLGSAESLTITVGIEDPDLVTEAVSATRTQDITVVRVTPDAPSASATTSATGGG